MALTEEAKKSLAGLWGGYDFYLIRDRHFKTASDMVERFLGIYEPWWNRSLRDQHAEFARNPTEVRRLLTEWAEKKLIAVTKDASLKTVQANIMFKQLLYDGEAINFGSNGRNWKTKTEIARELDQYKPWSVTHAASTFGSKAKLRRHIEAIIGRRGSPSEKALFDAWWGITDNGDRPMLFPQVWGHTSGKLWLPVSTQEVQPAFFSFGLVNVLNRTKMLIHCEPPRSQMDTQAQKVVLSKRNLAAEAGWLVFQFGHSDLSKPAECLEKIGDYLHY